MIETSLKNQSDTWVVIPTYNERDNIASLVEALNKNAERLTILIVDDSSPDRTAELVKQLQQPYPNLKLLIRQEKRGLGRAYLHGFSYALQKGAKRIVQMDADFSHDPADVERLIKALSGAQVVLGSRYSQGISVVNWPLRRLLISMAGNIYARLVTNMPFTDVTGGFKAWRAEVLQSIDLNSIEADGYGFQIITTYRAWKRGYQIKELPIIFTERREGQSKMNRNIVWEAVWIVWRLRLKGK